MNQVKRAIELFNFDRQPPLAVEKATKINTVEKVVEMLNKSLQLMDLPIKIDEASPKASVFEKFCKVFAFISQANMVLAAGLLIHGAINRATGFFDLMTYGRRLWLKLGLS